ncbi:MAG: DUF2110 family protein [Candidatus Bathyarchaeia archaeon]|jgi:hypothetical protein
MTDLTLLVKTSSARQLKLIDALLKSEFENLSVDVKVLGNSAGNWVKVSISGEDEVIATSYINKKIGTTPISTKKVNKFSILKGYISKINTAKQELIIDVGIFEPKIIQAAIPLAYLQAQLADGKKLDLQKISEIFGLRENLPLTIKVTRLNDEENEVLQAELSVEQIERIRLWQQSLLDRLIILGASQGEIETVLERTRLNRDIIDIEDLGMFEHALTCKLGTDAAGLVSKVGRYMRNSRFIVFNPKRLFECIGESALTL